MASTTLTPVLGSVRRRSTAAVKGREKTNPDSGHADVSGVAGRSKDFAHTNPKQLLGTYWNFVKNPLAGAAAMLVSGIGAGMALPNVQGELADLVQTASGLQKAHGRNIDPDVVGNDLDISIPQGFTPTFDLYLMAAGIRNETADERRVSGQIKGAIRRKIKDVRSGKIVVSFDGDSTEPPGSGPPPA